MKQLKSRLAAVGFVPSATSAGAMVRQHGCFRQVVWTTPHPPHIRVDVGIVIEDPFLGLEEQRVDYMCLHGDVRLDGVHIIDQLFKPAWWLTEENSTDAIRILEESGLPWLEQWAQIKPLVTYFQNHSTIQRRTPIYLRHLALLHYHAGDYRKSQEYCSCFLAEGHGVGPEEPDRTARQLSALREKESGSGVRL